MVYTAYGWKYGCPPTPGVAGVRQCLDLRLGHMGVSGRTNDFIGIPASLSAFPPFLFLGQVCRFLNDETQLLCS